MSVNISAANVDPRSGTILWRSASTGKSTGISRSVAVSTAVSDRISHGESCALHCANGIAAFPSTPWRRGSRSHIGRRCASCRISSSSGPSDGEQRTAARARRQGRVHHRCRGRLRAGVCPSLAAAGATIAIADIDAAAGDELARELTDEGRRALAVTCDVADERQVQWAIDSAVSELGGIDILINNAGKHLTKYNQPFSVLERKDIRDLFDVNVMGVINCSVSARPVIAQPGGGIIVNISSMAAYLNVSPYSVSKLAVRGLAVAFASEFADDNIRVNGIAPGLMATENALDDLPGDLVDEYVQRHQLIHRLGQMDDIVNAMLYLCSDVSSFMTGETLKVTGGYPLNI